MLVWYDEKYPQYLGIPSAIFDLGAVTGKGTSFRIMTLFTWSEGPRSSGVGFFCFVSSRASKQKKPTPLDRGPPLHVSRV